MASDNRQQAADLNSLLKNAQQYDFHQLVRMLARVDTPIKKNTLRYTSNASLSMQSTQVASLILNKIADSPSDELLLNVNFFGLIGPSGVMPPFYSSLVIQQLRKHDNALKNFFDMFHDRLLELYHEVWSRSLLFMQAERPYFGKFELSNTFTKVLKGLVGQGTAHLDNRMHFSDDVFIRYAGIIATNSCSASMIHSVLADFLQVPVEIVQYVPTWINISDDEQSRLSTSSSQNTYNNLGETVLIGSKVLNFQNHFRVRIGPLHFTEYHHYLPTAIKFKQLGELLRYLVGVTLHFSIQLILLAAEVPMCVISTRSPLSLGQTTCYILSQCRMM